MSDKRETVCSLRETGVCGCVESPIGSEDNATRLGDSVLLNCSLDSWFVYLLVLGSKNTNK